MAVNHKVVRQFFEQVKDILGIDLSTLNPVHHRSQETDVRRRRPHRRCRSLGFCGDARQLYFICQPSEVLIFAGLSRTTGDGRKVGYRTVRGGSALRIPVLEDVMRLDLSNMIIDLRVENAYSKGGIPVECLRCGEHQDLR